MKFDTRLLVKLLKEKKLKLALAESVSGGIASQRIANCKGASDVLAGSIVCYTPEVKMELMGVPRHMIEKYSCESEQVTAALVNGLTKLIRADVYAAVTGLASEGGSETEQKPVGSVFFAIRYKNKNHHFRIVFSGSPLEIRESAATQLFKHLDVVIRNT